MPEESPHKTDLTDLQITLLLLNGLKNQLESALKTLVPDEALKNEDLKFTIVNQIQILIYSFLEEWHRFERMGAEKDIQMTLKIASPALARIRKWTGLKKIRSMLLAHFSRNMKGGRSWSWDVFAEFKAPTAYAETILLGNCA